MSNSSDVVIEAPMSFTGSAKRLWKKTQVDNSLIRWAVLIPIVLGLIGVSWIVIAAWYSVFGIFLVPYRLLRRGSRRDKRALMQHRETLERISAGRRAA